MPAAGRKLSHTGTSSIPYQNPGAEAGNPTITVTPTTITVGANVWPATSVNVSYTYDYLFIDAVAGWFGGSFSDVVALQSQSTMRSEVSAGGGP